MPDLLTQYLQGNAVLPLGEEETVKLEIQAKKTQENTNVETDSSSVLCQQGENSEPNALSSIIDNPAENTISTISTSQDNQQEHFHAQSGPEAEEPVTAVNTISTSNLSNETSVEIPNRSLFYMCGIHECNFSSCKPIDLHK